VERNSYLRDGWNVVDFCIVMFSWGTMFLQNSSLSVIRTVRVLRSLRTLTVFPELQQLVTVLFRIYPAMANICFLCIVTVIVFACISMQLFSGSLVKRCVLETTVNPLADTKFNFTGETWYQMDGDALTC
jgi:hypothetical protein